jgi:hypothetical protein
MRHRQNQNRDYYTASALHSHGQVLGFTRARPIGWKQVVSATSAQVRSGKG